MTKHSAIRVKVASRRLQSHSLVLLGRGGISSWTTNLKHNVVNVDDQRAEVGRLDESWTRFGHSQKTEQP